MNAAWLKPAHQSCHTKNKIKKWRINKFFKNRRGVSFINKRFYMIKRITDLFRFPIRKKEKTKSDPEGLGKGGRCIFMPRIKRIVSAIPCLVNPFKRPFLK